MVEEDGYGHSLGTKHRGVEISAVLSRPGSEGREKKRSLVCTVSTYGAAGTRDVHVPEAAANLI